MFDFKKLSQFYRLNYNLAKIFAVSFLVLIFSCTDQGCIEADDFGEYETQVLEILASNNSDICLYNSSKPMTDSSQGVGLKACFISGNVEIYDENGDSQLSDKGCAGLPSLKFQNLCISQCISDCNMNAGSSSAASSEPNWVSTNVKGKNANGGVTLRPESEIKIRAIGSISLGDKFQYPALFVKSDEFELHSYDKQWNDKIIDLKVGKILMMSFSGQTTDNSTPNGGTTAIGNVGAGKSSVDDEKVHNAAKRLVAYIISHPIGYDFDISQPTEKAGTIGVPLLPDQNMWQCQYSGNNELQSDCNNKSYSLNGYPRADDALTNRVFPITSVERSATLGSYGGIIRWSNDGLLPDNFDHFQEKGVNCFDTACTRASEIDPAFGRIVGDISANDIEITAPVSAKVSFRYLLSNAACNGDLEIATATSDNQVISSQIIQINHSTWNSEHISIEDGQKILVKADPRTYIDVNGNSVSCGRALALKYAKYHDIRIDKSGLVSFATLGNSISGNCVINARIINKDRGSHIDSSPTYTADFYEYGDFSSISDPLNKIMVPVLTFSTLWDNGIVDNGSRKAFVRKGQYIRFSPESWDNKWDAAVGERRCGVGMAMRIQQRPAFLCRGYGVDKVVNPDCTMDYLNGKLIGCSEYDPQCYNSQNSSSYCPDEKCLRPVNCEDGSENSNPQFTKTNCVLGDLQYTPRSLAPSSNGSSQECPFAYSGSSSQNLSFTESSCDSCSNLRKAKAEQSPFLDQDNVSFCYDLENYGGKVENIPITGFTSSQLSSSNFAKGAQNLNDFNGYYGNIGTYKNTGSVDVDFNNRVFEATKIMNVNESGRLKFLFLDGDNFKDIDSFYSDNTNSGSAYNGINGFRIDLASYLEFNNGQWLETILCAENSDSSVVCKSNARPTQISSQPQVVELDVAQQGNLLPRSLTDFEYNDFGELARIKPANGSGACEKSLVGDLYYCHTEKTLDVTKIRLSFKIKDPEEGNCNINQSVPEGQGFDGILITNPRYRASDCDVDNPNAAVPTKLDGITLISENGQKTCVKNNNAGKTCVVNDKDCADEFVCGDKYSNNSGRYYVTVRVKNPGSNISNVVDSVVAPVIEAMDGSKDGTKVGQAERIYRLIIDDPRYQAILSMCLILMLTFYGFGYLMGISDASISDIISRTIKISVIYLFVGPQGWEFFDKIVVQFFKNGTDYISFLMASSFDDSPELQNAIDQYDFYDKSILFKSVDDVFTLIFSSTVQKKISALLFANIFGFVYIIIIYYAIVSYVFAVSSAILLYLTAQVFISVLFVLGPLFFVFTLFNQTKEMFDKWLQQLIGFSLQQIFLLTTLAFFNMMMYEVTKMSLGYKVCWDEVWTINIITRITLMSWWTIPSLPPNIDSQIEVGNVGQNDGIPSFFAILFMWVIAKLMQQFITFMTEVASDIGGGISLNTLSSGVAKAVGSARGFASKRMNEAWKSTGGLAMKKLDQSLFDSGSLAKEARAIKRREMSQQMKQKSALEKAGRSAVNEYKSKNGADLAKLPKEDQLKKLNEIRNKGMDQKGKELGLSPEAIKKLKEDKGLKYVGDNIAGAGLKALYQSVRSGGTLTSSIKDQKTSASLSKKQAKDSLKNTDAKGRKDMIDAVKEGRLNVKAGMALHRAKDYKFTGESLKKLGRKVYDKEYDKARQQLVDEGEISKMRYGTEWARSDVEKKKIRDRAEKNKKASSTNVDKMSRASTVASLEMESQYLDDLEQGKESSDTLRENNLLTSVIGRRRFETGNKFKRQKMAEARDGRIEQVKKNLKTSLNESGQELELAQKEKQGFDSQIENISNDEYFKMRNNELLSLQSDIDSGSLSEEEKSKKISRLAEIKGNDQFKQKTSQLKEAYAGRNKASARVQNAQEKVGKLQSNLSAVEDMQEIYANSKEYVNVDLNAPGVSEEDKATARMAQEAVSSYESIASGRFDDRAMQNVNKFSNKYNSLK